MIKRDDNSEYGYEDRHNINGEREIVRVPLEFEIAEVKCDDGKVRNVRRFGFSSQSEFV
jgi:hypothetical protein